MWYYGRERGFLAPGVLSLLPTGRCGLAESDDGLTWRRIPGPGFRGSILDPNPEPGRFDSFQVGASDVVQDGDEYRLYYMAGADSSVDLGAGPRKGLPISAGLATSTDGVTFTRRDAPVLEPGPAGSWDATMIVLPRVLPVPGGWRLTYNAGGFIGYAEGDGVTFEKRGPVFGPSPDPDAFDARLVATRAFLAIPGGLLMVYAALGPDSEFRFGAATSADGLVWERLPGPGRGGCILDVGAPGSWDETNLGTPWLLAMADGTIRLYYVAFGPEGGIGLATCDGQNLTRWERAT